jgi:hypothetical protein
MKAKAGTALLDPIPSHLSQNVHSEQLDWPVEAAKNSNRLCATLLVSRKYQTLMRHQTKIRPTSGVFFPFQRKQENGRNINSFYQLDRRPSGLKI